MRQEGAPKHARESLHGRSPDEWLAFFRYCPYEDSVRQGVWLSKHADLATHEAKKIVSAIGPVQLIPIDDYLALVFGEAVSPAHVAMMEVRRHLHAWSMQRQEGGLLLAKDHAKLIVNPAQHGVIVGLVPASGVTKWINLRAGQPLPKLVLSLTQAG